MSPSDLELTGYDVETFGTQIRIWKVMEAVIELLQGPLWGRLVNVARVLIQKEQVFPSTMKLTARQATEAYFAHRRSARGTPPPWKRTCALGGLT
jgi:hypothetical protein